MFTVEFDKELLQQIVREEIQSALKKHVKTIDYPPLLTRPQLMEILHTGPTKTAELLARRDFPVMRDAGRVLIPTQAFFEWIDTHTQWIKDNANDFHSLL